MSMTSLFSKPHVLPSFCVLIIECFLPPNVSALNICTLKLFHPDRVIDLHLFKQGGISTVVNDIYSVQLYK